MRAVILLTALLCAGCGGSNLGGGPVSAWTGKWGGNWSSPSAHGSLNGSVKPSGKAEMTAKDLQNGEEAAVDAVFKDDGTFTGVAKFPGGDRPMSGRFHKVSQYVYQADLTVGSDVWSAELEKNGQGSDGEGTIDP